MHPSQGHGVARPQQFPAFPQRTHTYHGVPVESNMSYQGMRHVLTGQRKANRIAGHLHPVERTYSESLPSNSPWLSNVSPGYEMHGPIRDVSPGHPNDPRYWPYEQSPGSGDFAPFPHEAAQRVRTPSSTFNPTFSQPSPEQQWQLQQPGPCVPTTSYPLTPASMASTVPQYAACYAPAPQHVPAASYPPFSVPFESPQAMRPMQGPPYSTPIPQSHSFPEHGVAYQQPGPPEQPPVSTQGYPGSWYAEATGLGVSMDQQAPPTYVVPSQRPR